MDIILLLAELVPCLVIGFFLEKFKENFSLFISRPLINYGIPISLTGLLLKSGINSYLLEAMIMAWLVIGLQIILIRVTPTINEKITSKALQLGVVFGNTGYFGIPVALSLVDNKVLNYSIGFDLGATLVIWSLGPILLAQSKKQLPVAEKWKVFFMAIANSPASKGLIGACIIQATPWYEQIKSFLWAPSKVVIVLALLIVGMRLAKLKKFNSQSIASNSQLIRNCLILKLVALPTLMFILCNLLKFSYNIKSALVLQAAAPTAISVLLIAQANSQDEDKATLLVSFSTLAALVTIPIWSFILKI